MPNLRTTPSPMPRNAGFNDRLDAAAAAKTAMLERFRAKQHDPTLLERQAAQQAIDEARNVRRADRKAAGDAEAARQATERVAVAAERTAREAEERRLAQETAARAVALGAEQKTRRDARYAARKARR